MMASHFLDVESTNSLGGNGRKYREGRETCHKGFEVPKGNIFYGGEDSSRLGLDVSRVGKWRL